MREILFRGKCVDTGNWYEGQYIHLHKTTYCFAGSKQRDDENEIHQIVFEQMTDWNLPNRHLRVDVLPETVGQYTGLTDKNGKKIFEGDIAKLYSNDYIPSEYIGEVMIKDGLAGIEYTPDYLRGKGFDPYFHHFGYVGEWRDMGASGKVTYSYEIIGNIHDNPELLKGGE